VRSGRLLIRVDDRHATYPLRIDPLVQQAKLTASDGADNDLFGAAVAVSPDTIAVGALGHSVDGNPSAGAVYVFQKSASGWAHATQSAELTVSGGAADDTLGDSVAISGDTIFAGATNRTVDGNQSQGAVYVFAKPASGWKNATQTAELVASDGRKADGLGAAVAASGDTVVAASDQHTVGNNVLQGEGYVFVKPASGWENSNESAILTSSDGAAGDSLGTSVAISGDTIALGALYHKVGANPKQGSAYVYAKPALGWTGIRQQTTELTATDGAAGDQFGHAVAVSGDTAFVGAPTLRSTSAARARRTCSSSRSVAGTRRRDRRRSWRHPTE
jgi:FG-GAP repeat